MGGVCSKSSKVIGHDTDVVSPIFINSLDFVKAYLPYVTGELSDPSLLVTDKIPGLFAALRYLRKLYADSASGVNETHVKGLLKGLEYLIKFDNNKHWFSDLSLEGITHPHFETDLMTYLDDCSIYLRSILSNNTETNQSGHLKDDNPPPKKRLLHHSRPHATEVRERVMRQLQALLPKQALNNQVFNKIISLTIEFHDFEQLRTQYGGVEYDSNERVTVAQLMDYLKSQVIKPLEQDSQYCYDSNIQSWLRHFRETTQFIMDHVIEIATTPIFSEYHVYDVGGRLVELLVNVDELEPYRQQLKKHSFLASVYLTMGVMGVCDKYPAALPRLLNEELNINAIANMYPKEDHKPLKDWFESKYFIPYIKLKQNSFTFAPYINQHIFLSIIPANIGMCVELAGSSKAAAARNIMGWIECLRCCNNAIFDCGINNQKVNDDMQTLFLNDSTIKDEAQFSAKQITNLTSLQANLSLLFSDWLQNNKTSTLPFEIWSEVANIHQHNLRNLLQFYKQLGTENRQQLALALLYAVSHQVGEYYVNCDDNCDKVKALASLKKPIGGQDYVEMDSEAHVTQDCFDSKQTDDPNGDSKKDKLSINPSPSSSRVDSQKTFFMTKKYQLFNRSDRDSSRFSESGSPTPKSYCRQFFPEVSSQESPVNPRYRTQSEPVSSKGCSQ